MNRLAGTSAHAQATAVLCKDGSASATAGRGTCSGHGGVDRAASKAAAKIAKKQAKAATQAAKRTQGTEVTVTCADGSISHTTGRGACARHGGIKAASATSRTTKATIAVPGTVTPRDRGAKSPTMNPPVASGRAREVDRAATSGSGALGMTTNFRGNSPGAPPLRSCPFPTAIRGACRSRSRDRTECPTSDRCLPQTGARNRR